THVVDSPLASRAYGQLAVGHLEEFLGAVQPFAQAYARHFRVVGASTSLVMLETQEDYRRFGIVPKDDAKTVKDKTVETLVLQAMDALATRLGDAKVDLLHRVEKLQELPGVEVHMPTDVREAMNALPAERFEVQIPSLRAKHVSREGVGASWRKELAQRQPGYDSTYAEAERRLKAHGPADALVALSSLVEAKPGDGVLARDVGFTAMEWGMHAHAYYLLDRLAEARPFEPQTWRSLALASASMGAYDLAAIYYEVALAGQWDLRFGEFRAIVMQDYVRFAREHADELSPQLRAVVAEHIAKYERELGIEGADIVITITWNTDRTDVDLHVTEPSGEECYYSHPKTRSGGRLTRDVTQGYGPEMFVLEKAPKGTYRVRVKYFSSDANRTSTRTKVYATVTRNWGEANEKVERKVVTLESGQQMHDVVSLKF
ncbi:MAG: DUF2135 domain-containing protein, partial [Myxococcota bacterium]